MKGERALLRLKHRGKKARFKEEWPGAVRGVNQCGNFSLLYINQSGDTALIDAWIVRNCTLRGVNKGLPPKHELNLRFDCKKRSPGYM